MKELDKAFIDALIESSPCKDCYRAELQQIDDDGFYWGCDMSFCIQDPELDVDSF